MNRDLTLQEKIAKLVSNSFHTIDNNIRQGEQRVKSNARWASFCPRL